MAKVKIGFNGLSVTEQIERARLIVTKMTGNSNFTTPNPSLATVSTAATALETAYNNSRGGDKTQMAIMRLRRKELLALMVQLGAYVQETSAGDEEVILSSGFDIVRPRTPKPEVAGEVRDVQVSDGSVSGAVKVTWQKADNAVIYVVMISMSADFANAEPKGITTKTQKEIDDLNAGTTYYVRVLALGRERAGPLSETVSIMVR